MAKRRARRGERAERSARVVDGDQVPRATVRAARSTSAARRRSACACARKSWPSKRSPRSATNRSPRRRLRVSVVTRDEATPPRRRREPPTSARGGRRVHHASPPARKRMPRRTAAIGERQALAVDFLVVLVALAGDQHDVARARACERTLDRRRAVELDRPVGRRSTAMPATIASMIAARILAARVVAGDDDAVGERAGDRAHQRPLAGDRGRRRSRTRTPGAPPLRTRRAQRRAAPSRARRACARSRRRRAAPVAPPSRCMRPGGGVHASRARRSASSSAMPLASSTPSTPSRFGTLKRPTSDVDELARAPRRRDANRERRAGDRSTRGRDDVRAVGAVREHLLPRGARTPRSARVRTRRRR